MGDRLMNWDAVGAIGEIAGAIAVFVTLLYLAMQVRQTNKMARFETMREIIGQFNALNLLYATDSKLREVLLTEGVLPVEQEEQLYAYVDSYCNAWATAQSAFDQGQIDDALFNGVVRDVEIAITRWPSMRRAVERWVRNYPELASSEVFRTLDQN
jgi:hypothetical protein